MKKIFSIILCAAVVLVSGCSKQDNNSANPAPVINEFGIEMSEKDFISAFSEKSGLTVNKEDIDFDDYIINGNSDDKIYLGTDGDKITHLLVSCTGATEDKANSVERVTDYFKSVILVLYPNSNSDEINDLLKKIRYEEAENDRSPKGYLFNDVYIMYYTSFGVSGLTFSNSDVTIAHWRIESIEYYNK